MEDIELFGRVRPWFHLQRYSVLFNIVRSNASTADWSISKHAGFVRCTGIDGEAVSLRRAAMNSYLRFD